ncbi:putative breast cancer type 1 susceptibility protein [Apostichopus japonicus]|uniref:Putative breast cancer type 1 susceptibility protein n=1 Tax=Stichopus japonicus TaxID=307972 RepID=A0A2G8KGN7_STIJA|nr:putative breast cancer type 1 susceptibility protein [Apostichopus japonicus]
MQRLSLVDLQTPKIKVILCQTRWMQRLSSGSADTKNQSDPLPEQMDAETVFSGSADTKNQSDPLPDQMDAETVFSGSADTKNQSDPLPDQMECRDCPKCILICVKWLKAWSSSSRCDKGFLIGLLLAALIHTCHYESYTEAGRPPWLYSRYTAMIESTTTHVILIAEKGKCPRTMKYITGIAAGLWIVSYSWVQSSLKAGRLLAEADFEIIGDSLGVHYGPMRARTRREGKPLLSKYSISLLGESSSGPEDEFENLLKLSGANGPDACISIAVFNEEGGKMLDENDQELSDESSDEYIPEHCEDSSSNEEAEVDQNELAELCDVGASGKEEHLTAQAALRDNPDREGTNHAPFVVTTETDSKYCYCPFCDKSQEKLPRHCKMLHAEEVLVAKASSISKDHVQDIREEWRKIRNMGNHKHNTLVFQRRSQ